MVKLMKALSELAKDALELPVAQRRILARILLELSEEDQDFSPEIDAAWEQEITQRIEALKAGRAQSRSFEEVFASLDQRFGS